MGCWGNSAQHSGKAHQLRSFLWQHARQKRYACHTALTPVLLLHLIVPLMLAVVLVSNGRKSTVQKPHNLPARIACSPPSSSSSSSPSSSP